MRDRSIVRENPGGVVTLLAPRHRKKRCCQPVVFDCHLKVLANRGTAYQRESIHSICRQWNAAACTKRGLGGFR